MKRLARQKASRGRTPFEVSAATGTRPGQIQMRIAILCSHPIQYQAPLFRKIASQDGVDLEVFFCSERGLQPYTDPGFLRTFAWDVPVLGGYSHRFLRNVRPKGGPGTFAGLINPGIGPSLARGAFDAVLVHGWAYATNWMCFAAAGLARLPIILRGEANIDLEPSGTKLIWKKALLSRLFARVSRFAAIGDRNVAFYRSYGVPEEKIVRAPYSVDNEFFQSQATRYGCERAALREAFGVTDDGPVILFCGKFRSAKRPLDLLQAYESVGPAAGAWLLFVGDGELRCELERYVAVHNLARVRFAGFLNQSEISKAYTAADLLVLPSSHEPWGLVVNEALCFGLPVIASDRVGASWDLVRSGHNGYTYPCGDIDALAARLQALLSNRQFLQSMSANSKSVIAGWGLEQTTVGIVNAARSAVHAIS